MKQATYGVDIAVRRADDLDRRALTYVKKRMQNIQGTPGVPCVRVLDLGCGAGGQAVRMAVVGATVVGMDVDVYADAFERLRTENTLTEAQLDFIQGDVIQLDALLDECMFDICCFQRTLHYLPYDQAYSVLVWLREHIKEKLYISVTGLESDIGLHYADAHKPVEERFCALTESDAETFCITEPVCLYTPEEFIVLLQDSGWEIEECWVSAFGNIKTICR